MNRFFGFTMILLLVSLISGFAQGPSVYLGGSVGSSFVQTKPLDIPGEELKIEKIDKNGFAYKVYAGVKLLRFLGAEGGYRSLGTIKDTKLGTEVESNTKGFDLFAKGTLDLTMLEVFAKAGYFFWNSEVSIAEIKDKTNANDFAWGVGAGLKLGNITVRAEWEQFNVEDLDKVAMLTAGVTFSLM
jgi:opacity protein-like surface antigen